MKTPLLIGFALPVCLILLAGAFIIGSRLIPEPPETFPKEADALFNTACIPKVFEDSDQYGTTSGTICTNCKGWLTSVRLYDSGGDGGNARIYVDGNAGDQLPLGGSRVTYDNYWFFMAHFNNNITYTLADSGGGFTFLAVTYCEE